MCERCEYIRYQASLITVLTLRGQSTMNVLQTIAVMHAMIRHSAIQADREDTFNKLWDEMKDCEFKQISLENPIEPAKFDDKFDVREHLKK